MLSDAARRPSTSRGLPRLASALAAVTALGAVPFVLAIPVAQAAPGDPSVVAVGSGSYAAAPPASLDANHSPTVSATVDQALFIDSSQDGRPVPTNAWWTDLVVSRYSGNLWADPLVNANSATGTTVHYPTRWNADGTAMRLEQPLVVGGTVTVQPAPSDVVLADFDSATGANGWTATGDAFTVLPSAGTNAGQSPVAGFLGTGLANSFTDARGDGATGTLTSPTFTVDRAAAGLMVGGGDHPGAEEVQLVVDGQVVASATGENSETLRWVTWDLSAHAGRQAQVRVVDTLQAGWAHVLVDQVVLTDDVDGLATRFDPAFRAESAEALRWGDQNVSWRMQQTGGSQHVDVSASRGMPYTWFEYTDMAPRLTLAPGAVVTGADGRPVTFPLTTDRFAVTQGGATFGVHVPAGTTFFCAGDVLTAETDVAHLVVSAVPASGATLDDLHRTAFAVPRDVSMESVYDQAAGTVSETWTVEAEALEGTNTATVQGWLPHHHVETTHDLQFAPFGYATPRGPMQVTVGDRPWTVTYPFTGITPTAALPDAAEYDPERMRRYVAEYAERTTYGGDTYWGGKDLQQYAEYMLIAQQIGDTEAFTSLQSTLRTALTDWYTYTPGETEHYFARYDTWKALVGFGDSYGSYQFTDNHFHYGYFTLATALLGLTDPEFTEQYGDMATLVAKQYANWDREDADFPYQRTFDTFEGHSYAGGYSSPGGNNQESSSEAIQSWAGLYLLGTVLGDAEMQAEGAMGYVTERASVRQYWLDAVGSPAATDPQGPSTFPEAFDHTTVGILFDSGPTFANYFSGDPAWTYGIQWLPTAPWLNYLGWDPAFSRSRLADLFALRPAALAAGVPGDVAGRLQAAAKSWHGVGTYGTTVITLDRAAAIGDVQNAVRTAYLHDPAYVTARTADNPLYDAGADRLLVTVAADGTLGFPADVWTPGSLPTALTPIAPPAGDPDADPRTWGPAWPLFSRLSTDYAADPAVAEALYAYDAGDYRAGEDTAQAAAVYSRIGDALGNVLLGYLAQADPAQYVDIADALWEAQDPVATSQSMAGIVYWNALSNLGTGPETLDRHTGAPLSQVYRAADGTYTYVVHNPTDTERAYPVHEGTGAAAREVGTIRVPAHTTVRHHLDAALDHVEVTTADAVRTVQPGSSVAFTATGIDQYGATIALDEVRWEVSGGGTISAAGVFTATTEADPVTVTATSGGTTQAYTLRVAPAPVLTTLTVTPGWQQVVTGQDLELTATGRDQYGDPMAAEDLTWSATAPGTVTGGRFTAGATGSGFVTATAANGATGSAVLAVVAPLADVAQGRPVTASSELGGNTAALVTDGRGDTRWESVHGSDEEWLQIDLGAEHDVRRVHVDWEGAAAGSYELSVSNDPDGGAAAVQTVTKTDAGDDDLVVAATGRYVRITGLTRLTAYGYSAYGVEVYGTPSAAAVTPTTVLVGPPASTVLPGATTQLAAYAFDAAGNGGPLTAATPVTWTATAGQVDATGRVTAPASGSATVTATVGGVAGTATVDVRAQAAPPAPEPVLHNVALDRPVTASSVEWEGTPLQDAVDGRHTTRWSSAWGSDDEWIEVDLGQVTPISRVTTDWEAAHATSFRIQVRDSVDAPWQQVGPDRTGSVGETAHDVAASARYLRVQGLTRATGYGYSLWELGVWSPVTAG
ncbi:glycosyl hydrolase [Modestobacter sp. VKM Ac-2986]|uniref:glycosyl hydrolase n=1 Tax=Modestobacter sp. VKM Ac-2986 TaxID=3004140 RepID=UPI0022ABB482|nr:glycosyl hydrolase [Modestobacter sp. VKM Ac-2986]MCZ2831116.1 glycosyl hydrolase [Modestobacter sp. VKM Ac-2986]